MQSRDTGSSYWFYFYLFLQCNVKETRTVPLTRHANPTNVWTLVLSPYVGAEHSASLKDTRASVSVLLACKATPMCLAQKLAVNPMRTVHTMRSVIFQAHHLAGGNVWGYVSPPLVPKGLAVKQRTTRRFAPAIIHYKEMDTFLA